MQERQEAAAKQQQRHNESSSSDLLGDGSGLDPVKWEQALGVEKAENLLEITVGDEARRGKRAERGL